jgi:hypothetical protein
MPTRADRLCIPRRGQYSRDQVYLLTNEIGNWYSWADYKGAPLCDRLSGRDR